MKRFALIIVAILAIAGLVLSGCNDKKKDKAEVPETGKAAKAATEDKAVEELSLELIADLTKET